MIIKRKCLFLILCLTTVLLGGCTNDGYYDNAKVESEGKIVETMLGDVGFEHIQGNLYYDKVTGIVYLIGVTYGGFNTYCPYYAPNGLPYYYNIETQTFIEINPFEYYMEEENEQPE